jgi:predicted amidohydrolase YtcJ
LTNGRILTLDAHSTVVEALTIRGNRIIAIGAATELRGHANETKRIIDLGGRTVIPGLIDSHIHAIRDGLRFHREVSWIGAKTIPEGMDRIRQAALYGTPGTWIVVGGGWTPSQFDEARRPTQDDQRPRAHGGRGL